MTMGGIKHVAVIGAGPSGLTAVKSLIEQGMIPTAFEKAGEIGGLWRYDESLPDGGGVAYRSLHTNTSKWMGVFSDFPFEPEAPEFPSRAEMLAYFHRYADHFNLRGHIRLQTEVTNLHRTPDGRWQLTLRGPLGNIEEQPFDAVVVGSGFYPLPYQPDLAGVNGFEGEVLHSCSYKGPEGFEGKRIVVVGCGSSGADLAAELGPVAAQVNVSTREGVWFVPKMINGRAYDTYRTRFTSRMPGFLSRSFFRKRLLDSYAEIGFDDQTLERLKLPPFDLEKGKFLPATDILLQVRDGNVNMMPEIAAVGRNVVRYVDGSESNVDVILFATGYRLHFPFLDPDVLEVSDRYTIGLYRQVFHKAYDNLAFLAMNFAGGAAFPLMEIQARWLSLVFSGKMRLPSPRERSAWIDAYMAQHAAAGTDPMSLQLLVYLVEMAELLGIRPKWWKRPGLLGKLIFGAHVPAQYRLDGPGHEEEAAAVIAAQEYIR